MYKIEIHNLSTVLLLGMTKQIADISKRQGNIPITDAYKLHSAENRIVQNLHVCF